MELFDQTLNRWLNIQSNIICNLKISDQKLGNKSKNMTKHSASALHGQFSLFGVIHTFLLEQKQYWILIVSPSFINFITGVASISQESVCLKKCACSATSRLNLMLSVHSKHHKWKEWVRKFSWKSFSNMFNSSYITPVKQPFGCIWNWWFHNVLFEVPLHSFSSCKMGFCFAEAVIAM